MNAHNAALLDEFCDAVWLEDGLAKNTLDSYRRDLRLFARWHEGQGRASLLSATEADLAAYLASRSSPRGAKKRGIRSSTQARLHSSLKRLYQFLARGRRIEVDPTLKLDPPKKPPRFPRTLSEEDVEALLAQPDTATPLGLRDRAMLEVLYASGLRVSELVHLKLAEVSFDMGVVRVFGKGGKERLVPLGEEAIAWLSRYSKEGRPALLRKRPSDYVFVTWHGAPMARRGRHSRKGAVAAHAAPRFRDSPPQSRRGPARGAASAWSRRHLHHTDLHTRRARAPEKAAQGPPPQSLNQPRARSILTPTSFASRSTPSLAMLTMTRGELNCSIIESATRSARFSTRPKRSAARRARTCSTTTP
jgi:integrase/recombinase XerD